MKREVKRMDLQVMIKERNLVESLLNGVFGLEKEGLRATFPAYLADTSHPKSLGDREKNPYIKTDYGEAQPELVTPPLTTYTSAYSWLQTLSSILLTSLPRDEYIWPFSMPCHLPTNEEEIRTSKSKNPELVDYRKYTAEKYGKKRQLVSGIHINYSLDKTFIQTLFEAQDTFSSIEMLQNELYLKLASNFLRYQWLLVYLFGATPIAEKHYFVGPFFRNMKRPMKAVRSLRNSPYGFTNQPDVIVRYDSIENYSNDLQKHVTTGLLNKEREFYGAVRLRGMMKDSSSLLEHGIQYLEFRSFDNNPYHVSGLTLDTLEFIHLFFLTLLLLPEKATEMDVRLGNHFTKKVAMEHPLSKTKRMEEGIWLIEQMRNMVETFELDRKNVELLNRALDCLAFPEKTISGQILTELNQGTTFYEMGQHLGMHHKLSTLTADTLPGLNQLSEEEKRHLIQVLKTSQEMPEDYKNKVN